MTMEGDSVGAFTKRSSGASRGQHGRSIGMVTLALVLVASGCSGGAGSGAGAAPAAAGQQVNLKGVCPDPVVVQTPWVPQAEHGALYELLGSGYRVDTAHKRVSGPLVAHGGKATGVRIELRAGGPAIGFQSAAQTMYLDPSITLGEVATDDAITASAHQPVTAVVAPFELAPYMLMWDPKIHPDWHTIGDIGQTNTKVLYFKSATYMDYLLGAMLDAIDGFAPATDDSKVAAALDDRLHQMVDTEFARLRDELTDPCGRLRHVLPGEHAALLHREFHRWLGGTHGGWTLINAADPCGT
jgi:hypothetical protein